MVAYPVDLHSKTINHLSTKHGSSPYCAALMMLPGLMMRDKTARL